MTCQRRRLSDSLAAMRRAIGIPFLCLAMFGIAGGHWAVLQSIAWARMVSTFPAMSR
jgi:hypothetical protein